MSVKIFRELVTDQQVEIIRKFLILTPKIKSFNKNKFLQEDKAPIQFYHVRDDPITQKKCLYLPFQFANTLFNTICNYQLVYPSIKFDFTAKLRDYQEEDTKLAIQQLNTFCTTTLNFSTGAGKTICSAYLASKIQLITLVVVHLEILRKQWEKNFKDTTNAKLWVVGEMDQPKEFDVIICMDQRASKIPAEVIASVGVLILDEVDRLVTQSRVDLFLSIQPKYIIGLTATLDMRTDGMDSMYHCILGTHKVVRILAKNLTMYRIKTKHVPEVKQTARGADWSVIVRSLAENEERNWSIVDFVLKQETHKILIICNLIEHTQALYDMVLKRKAEDKNLNEYKYSVDFYSGSKKKYKDSRILIGGIKKVGIGFDDANAAEGVVNIRINMLVMVTSTKDESLITQVLGRIRVQNPIIVYFVDNNNTIKRHYNETKKFVLSKGGQLIDVEENQLSNLEITNPDLAEVEIDSDEDRGNEDRDNEVKEDLPSDFTRIKLTMN